MYLTPRTFPAPFIAIGILTVLLIGCARQDSPPETIPKQTPSTEPAVQTAPPEQTTKESAPEPAPPKKTPPESADPLATEVESPAPEPAKAPPQSPQAEPDAAVERVPVSVSFTEAEVLNDSTYVPEPVEIEAIKQRLQPLLEREIDVTGMAVVYGTRLSTLCNVAHNSGAATAEPPPENTKSHYRIHYQGGRVRYVSRVVKGKELIHQRVFYDDAGAPAVVFQHAFGNRQPREVHYLQYDEDGYLHRYLEFWASGSELQLRAVYVLHAKDQYRDVTKYRFSDSGKFDAKYVYSDKAAFSQSRKDTKPKRMRVRPFLSYNNRPLSYGMKTILPVPEK